MQRGAAFVDAALEGERVDLLKREGSALYVRGLWAALFRERRRAVVQSARDCHR